MRGKHTGGKETGVEAVAQQIITHRKAQGQRDDEGKEPEQEGLVPVGLELVHVELESGDEHDIQESDGREQVHRGIVLHPVQGIGAYGHPGKDEHDDTRNIESAKQDGGDQDDQQDEGKDQDGIGKGSLELVDNVVYNFIHRGSFGGFVPDSSRKICSVCRAIFSAFPGLKPKNCYIFGLKYDFRLNIEVFTCSIASGF